MKYYSAIKKNAFESVLMRWMKLEPIIQNEVDIYSLEEGMATHSCILAWRIPLTDEPGKLQSTGSHRVGYD